MEKLRQGAEQAIRVCLGLKEGEQILIITDNSTINVGKILEKVAKEITNKVFLVKLEELGERPLKEVSSLIESLKKMDVAIFAAKKKGDNEISETYTLRRPLRIAAAQNKVRYAGMQGVNEKIMETGMAYDQKKLWEINNKVFDKVKNAKRIVIMSDAGTNLTLRLGEDIEWINSNSNLTTIPQEGFNLPGCEVFTAPIYGKGNLVVDGILGDFFTKYGFLDKKPLRLWINNGRIEKLECDNSALESEFSQYIKKDENANRIGEIGLGTNLGIKELVGVVLQDEKMPGVHIAFGDPYPERTKADWSSKVHCDAIIKDADVWIDSEKIMEKGKYLFLD